MRWILSVFLLAGMPVLASAQVDRFVAIGGSDSGNDCLNEASPCASIAHAISQSAPFDTIVVGPGEFTESIVIDRSLTMAGAGRQATTIQAFAEPGQAAGRVVLVNSGQVVTLRDLGIRHGNAVSGSTQDRNGAGLYSDGAELSLERVLFEANIASNFGGGMFSRNSSPSLIDVAFRNNQAFRGGGLYNTNSSPLLLNVAFLGNAAQEQGGGLYSISGSHPVLTNVLFSGNFADIRGGGLYGDASSAILTNVTFSANAATDIGGGMDTIGNAQPEIRNSIFWNNQDDTGIGTARASLANSFSTTTTISFSLVQGCRPAAQWSDACGIDGGNNLTDATPEFEFTPSPLQAPTVAGNLRLTDGSPAIDAGNSSLVDTIDTDLDGLTRIFGAAVDLGPYEFGSEIIFRDRFEVH